MSYYNGNISADPMMVGDLPEPYYWWEAGAMWGAMLDYYHYTGDPSYNDAILQALLHPANTGPAHDFMPPNHRHEEGNDDLGFWGFAVMSAAERNFPQPNPDLPSWLGFGDNIFNSLVSRWNTTHCGGGLLWQIFADNPNGLNYKNSVSNGGLFQLSARLARATGNTTYLDWAHKVWDWTEAVGFIGSDFSVFDGGDSRNNCSETNYLAFTYTTGIFLHGAAVLANHTDDPVWAERATNILATAKVNFFGPYENSTDIMYEYACETVERCNVDMKAFKGFLSRFMWQSTQLLPSLTPMVGGRPHVRAEVVRRWFRRSGRPGSADVRLGDDPGPARPPSSGAVPRRRYQGRARGRLEQSAWPTGARGGAGTGEEVKRGAWGDQHRLEVDDLDSWRHGSRLGYGMRRRGCMIQTMKI
jgi:mannan endo-1,6-alpha-mannosidase